LLIYGFSLKAPQRTFYFSVLSLSFNFLTGMVDMLILTRRNGETESLEDIYVADLHKTLTAYSRLIKELERYIDFK
jgi:hypothetical protein